MRVAAANAATLIARRKPDAARIVVYAGPGNNGGDGWAVARSLATAGARVRVSEVAPSATPDACFERDAFRREFPSATDTERAASTPPVDSIAAGAGDVVVDALLGVGGNGPPRGAIADAVAEINCARARGAFVVALDVPSGLDATTGSAENCVLADMTISFATFKRGQLTNRGRCGDIATVDIGIPVEDFDLPQLVGADFVRASVPAIAATAHKGTRGSVAVIAGARGMGGASIIAAIGALRSGAGLVRVVTDDSNFAAVHARVPEALTGSLSDVAGAIVDWADAVVIGPGLGRGDGVRALVESALRAFTGPILLDADALNAFDGDVPALAALVRGRPALITPHPAELARLLGSSVEHVLAERYDIGRELAARLGATVLLKGTPTVVTDPAGERWVVAAGTPALATGGSGDALSGMIGALLAQGVAPTPAAAATAWVHGRAAELTPGVRGFRLTDVLRGLPEAWRVPDQSALRYPVIAHLPAVA